MSRTSPMPLTPIARQTGHISQRDAAVPTDSEKDLKDLADRSVARHDSHVPGTSVPHDAIDPRALSKSDVIALQRTHGNAYVQRVLLQRDPHDKEVKEHLEAGKKATEVAAKKDAAARTRGLKGKQAEAKAFEAAKADAAAAKHYVAALHKLAASRERAQLSLGKTRGGRDVNAYFFKGAISDVALVIAGVHGSELSGVEVAETLIKRLSAKGAPTPFFSVVIVPQLFPDNVAVKRAWEKSQKDAWEKVGKDAEKQQKAYQEARDDPRNRDPGRFTKDRRHGAVHEPNRQFPELGKPFDPNNPVDSKGRPIERENIMLLTLIDRFQPTRIAALHAIKNPKDAGVYADPHPSLKGLSSSEKELAERAHKLAQLVAEAAKRKGAKVPGNWRDGKFTSLYPGQDPKMSAEQIKRENKAGRSLGQWGPSQGPIVLTIEVNEQYASDPPVKHPGRKKELDAHAEALQETFVGPSLAAFAVEDLWKPAIERLRRDLRRLLLLPPAASVGPSRSSVGGNEVQRQYAAPAQTLARQAAPTPAPEKHYTLKAGVKLSAEVEKQVAEIADDYYAAQKKEIVVTSGTRSAASQAAAMYNKLEAGDDIVKLYVNKKAAKEIKEAYDKGKKAKKSRTEIIDAMKQVIEKQIKAGTYISKHLRAGAVDVRSRDMTADDKKAFRKAAKGKATKVILETKPPHWHLQF